MNTIDPEALAADFLRALRGRRSQRSLSRRLGYRTNIAYRWESRRCWPTAAKVFQALARLGHTPLIKLRAFYVNEPNWLRSHAHASPALVRDMLEDLRGCTSLVNLSDRSGYSRFRLARWLSGTAEPRLPEMLHLIEVMSLRLLDFVSLFFDPLRLPSVAGLFERHEALRQAAYDVPWSHAICACSSYATTQSCRDIAPAGLPTASASTRKKSRRRSPCWCVPDSCAGTAGVTA